MLSVTQLVPIRQCIPGSRHSRLVISLRSLLYLLFLIIINFYLPLIWGIVCCNLFYLYPSDIWVMLSVIHLCSMETNLASSGPSQSWTAPSWATSWWISSVPLLALSHLSNSVGSRTACSTPLRFNQCFKMLEHNLSALVFQCLMVRIQEGIWIYLHGHFTDFWTCKTHTLM